MKFSYCFDYYYIISYRGSFALSSSLVVVAEPTEICSRRKDAIPPAESLYSMIVVVQQLSANLDVNFHFCRCNCSIIMNTMSEKKQAKLSIVVNVSVDSKASRFATLRYGIVYMEIEIILCCTRSESF